ncbi:MAG: hypothetical protein Q8K75_04095 [Chlamydiales bacterium]|nr:hypothetical protein [Chlamydiales bacterium]
MDHTQPLSNLLPPIAHIFKIADESGPKRLTRAQSYPTPHFVPYQRPQQRPASMAVATNLNRAPIVQHSHCINTAIHPFPPMVTKQIAEIGLTMAKHPTASQDELITVVLGRPCFSPVEPKKRQSYIPYLIKEILKAYRLNPAKYLQEFEIATLFSQRSGPQRTPDLEPRTDALAPSSLPLLTPPTSRPVVAPATQYTFHNTPPEEVRSQLITDQLIRQVQRPKK